MVAGGGIGEMGGNQLEYLGRLIMDCDSDGNDSRVRPNTKSNESMETPRHNGA